LDFVREPTWASQGEVAQFFAHSMFPTVQAAMNVEIPGPRPVGESAAGTLMRFVTREAGRSGFVHLSKRPVDS
jgi:hypothetical protein